MTKLTSSPLALGIWISRPRCPRTLFLLSAGNLRPSRTIPVLTTFISFPIPRQSGEVMHSGEVLLFGEQTSSPPRAWPQVTRFGAATRSGGVTHCGAAVQTRASMHSGAVTHFGGVMHFGVAQLNPPRLAFR